ncbi:MAG: TPM domain-containing protein [Ruminiclostridium sp.]|nr:TPM domain-containing protein [Ruminiclostridium sp.]
MKKLISLIIAVTLSAICSVTAFADSFTPVERTLPLVVDNADLLSDSEEATLCEKLEAVGNEHRCEVAVVTVNSTEGKSHMAYADDFYDYNGYGYGSNDDGLLFLLDMGAREMYITTHGTGLKAVTDYGREKLFDKVQGDIKSGDYYDAFMEYADIVDDYYTKYENGEAYDVSSDKTSPFQITIMNFVIAIIVAVIVAFAGTGSMKSKLKTVRSKPAASDYVKANSLDITNSNDVYLYRHVSKVKIESSSSSGGGSSSHRSSSGRSHGGGGRSF